MSDDDIEDDFDDTADVILSELPDCMTGNKRSHENLTMLEHNISLEDLEDESPNKRQRSEESDGEISSIDVLQTRNKTYKRVKKKKVKNKNSIVPVDEQPDNIQVDDDYDSNKPFVYKPIESADEIPIPPPHEQTSECTCAGLPTQIQHYVDDYGDDYSDDNYNDNCSYLSLCHHCCPIMSVGHYRTPHISFYYFNLLPILIQLDQRTFMNLRATCRFWKDICDFHTLLWKLDLSGGNFHNEQYSYLNKIMHSTDFLTPEQVTPSSIIQASYIIGCLYFESGMYSSAFLYFDYYFNHTNTIYKWNSRNLVILGATTIYEIDGTQHDVLIYCHLKHCVHIRCLVVINAEDLDEFDASNVDINSLRAITVEFNQSYGLALDPQGVSILDNTHCASPRGEQKAEFTLEWATPFHSSLVHPAEEHPFRIMEKPPSPPRSPTPPIIPSWNNNSIYANTSLFNPVSGNAMYASGNTNYNYAGTLPNNYGLFYQTGNDIDYDNDSESNDYDDITSSTDDSFSENEIDELLNLMENGQYNQPINNYQHGNDVDQNNLDELLHELMGADDDDLD